MPKRLWSRFSRNDDVATANASVVTASIKPTDPQRGQADDDRRDRSDRAREQEAQQRVELPVDVGGARRGRTDRDERDLTQADLTGPPGEEHQRDRDHRVDEHRGGEVGVLLAQHERQRDQEDDEEDPQPAQRPLDLGESQQLAGDRADVRRVLPTRDRLIVDPRLAVPSLQEQRGDHDHEHDRVDELGRTLVPDHDRLDRAEPAAKRGRSRRSSPCGRSPPR